MTIAIIVLELLAIVANFSLPFCQTMTLRYKAAEIVRQMGQVRTAAESAREQRGVWPAERAPGDAPPELAAFLPPGFTFTYDDYNLDWDHWTLAEGSVAGVTDGDVAAITVIAKDPRLSAMVARLTREGETRWTLSNRTTLVISEPEPQAR